MGHPPMSEMTSSLWHNLTMRPWYNKENPVTLVPLKYLFTRTSWAVYNLETFLDKIIPWVYDKFMYSPVASHVKDSS